MRKQPEFTEREMFHYLILKASARHDTYNHVQVKDWPNFRELGENILFGSFSWLGMSTHTRWINIATAIPVGSYISTPGDVVRDYLSLKFATRRRITAEQKAEIYNKRCHPLKAEPMYMRDAVYLDIKSAYWSIMSIVGWDVDYFPGRWLGAGESMIDFPYGGHKLTRNVMVTTGLPGHVKMWVHDKQRIYSRPIGSKFINLQLWSIVHDILNGVAYEMSEIAPYIHTDGYIVHSEDETAARRIIAAWGLPCSVKNRGECRIYGSGQYTFGPKTANNFPMRSTGMVGIRDNPYREWLRERVRKLSKLAEPALPAST